MNTRRANPSLSFAASVIAPLAILFGCSGEKTNNTETMPSTSASASGGSSTSAAPTSTNTTTSTGASGTSTGNTSTGGSATSGGSGASTSGGSGASTSGGSGASTSGGSGASSSGGSGASTSGGSGASSANSGGSDSAGDTSGPTGSESGETSGGGEFTMTEPWTAKDTCTPTAKDTCDDIPLENRSNFIGGGDVMPTITWTAGPEGTEGYAVVFQDLSNPADINQPRSVHWAMWGIPADVLSIGPDSIPPTATQDAWVGDDGAWFGSGACANVYELSVYALSGELDPQGNAPYTAVRDQLEGDDGTLVLARDYGRVTPKAPCQ